MKLFLNKLEKFAKEEIIKSERIIFEKKDIFYKGGVYKSTLESKQLRKSKECNFRITFLENCHFNKLLKKLEKSFINLKITFKNTLIKEYCEKFYVLNITLN